MPVSEENQEEYKDYNLFLRNSGRLLIICTNTDGLCDKDKLDPAVKQWQNLRDEYALLLQDVYEDENERIKRISYIESIASRLKSLTL